MVEDELFQLGVRCVCWFCSSFSLSARSEAVRLIALWVCCFPGNNVVHEWRNGDLEPLCVFGVASCNILHFDDGGNGNYHDLSTVLCLFWDSCVSPFILFLQLWIKFRLNKIRKKIRVPDWIYWHALAPQMLHWKFSLARVCWSPLRHGDGDRTPVSAVHSRRLPWHESSGQARLDWPVGDTPPIRRQPTALDTGLLTPHVGSDGSLCFTFTGALLDDTPCSVGISSCLLRARRAETWITGHAPADYFHLPAAA
jgi:hypothetical protein